MKRKINLSILFFFSSVFVFSQSIRVNLRNSTDGMPVSGLLNFVVDKTDSTVLGFAVSDENGNCTIPLVEMPKNKEVNLMVFGMGYTPYTVFDIYANAQKSVIVDFNLKSGQQSTELFKVYTSKNGNHFVTTNPILDSIPLSYYKEYLKLAEHYYNIGVKEQENYQKDSIEYQHEVSKIDSLIKHGSEIGYLMPPPPNPPEPYSEVVYLDSSAEKNIPVSMEGGWESFYNYFISNKQFQSQLERNGGLKVWLSTDSGYEAGLDTVVISAPKKGPVKGLRKLCYNILQKKLIMLPVVLGGNKVKLQDEMSFYIEFIYRKE